MKARQPVQLLAGEVVERGAIDPCGAAVYDVVLARDTDAKASAVVEKDQLHVTTMLAWHFNGGLGEQ